MKQTIVFDNCTQELDLEKEDVVISVADKADLNSMWRDATLVSFESNNYGKIYYTKKRVWTYCRFISTTPKAPEYKIIEDLKDMRYIVDLGEEIGLRKIITKVIIDPDKGMLIYAEDIGRIGYMELDDLTVGSRYGWSTGLFDEPKSFKRGE